MTPCRKCSYNTIELGADLKGDRWHRKQDKLGAAFVTNGISGE